MDIIIALIGLVVCFCFVGYSYKNHMVMKKKIIEGNLRLYLPDFESCIIKQRDFFRMKNSGDDLCEPRSDILPINYFEGCNQFVKKM